MPNLNYGTYDDETAQQEKEELDASGGGAEFMKLKVGRNVVRILPPPPGKRTPFRVVYQHFIELGALKQSIICARLEAKKHCAVCEKVDEMRKSRNKVDQDMAGDWYARRRVFVNVIDRADPEKGVKVLAIGKSIHEQLTALRTDEEAGANYVDPITGNDIVIERTGTGKNDTKYKVMLGKQKPLGTSNEIMQELIDTQHNLDAYAKLKTVEEVRQLLAGETDEDSADAAPPPRRGAAAGKGRRNAEDDAIDVEAEDA